MALPSVVTLGSMAFVVAAAAGYAVVSTGGSGSAQQAQHRVVRPGPPQTTPTATPGTPVTHTAQPPHSRLPAVPSVLVWVFNNTGVPAEVADRKAAILRGAGWNVTATDNWYGNIPADTVYYPPQLKAAAVKLAKVLHITRLHTAVAPMQLDRLTVIIASS